jgi:hypothetical protein
MLAEDNWTFYENRDRCYEFQNIFAKKFGKSICVFLLKPGPVFLKFYHNIGFWEKRIFPRRNWQKSKKIVIITWTPVSGGNTIKWFIRWKALFQQGSKTFAKSNFFFLWLFCCPDIAWQFISVFLFFLTGVAILEFPLTPRIPLLI